MWMLPIAVSQWTQLTINQDVRTETSSKLRADEEHRFSFSVMATKTDTMKKSSDFSIPGFWHTTFQAGQSKPQRSSLVY